LEQQQKQRSREMKLRKAFLFQGDNRKK